jgi:CHAT domain-containing protein
VTSLSLRTAYLARYHERYELLVDVLMRLHRARPRDDFDVQAFEAAEAARARGLMDLLVLSGADIRGGVDPGLLERERSARAALDEATKQELKLRAAPRSGADPGETVSGVERAAAALADVEAEVQVRSPRYAALTQPRPLALAAIQGQALDPDTVLLEYALGREHSYLWAVTTTSLKSYELPPRADVEVLARKVYRNWSAGPEANESEAAADLGQLLLGPVAGRLGHKRLLVVADGALEYVPFAALPQPGATGGGRPLVVDHEVVSVPSASTLVVLRQEEEGRAPARRSVAILADPVFSRDDPRVGHPGGEAAEMAHPEPRSSRLDRSSRDVGLQRFERLPGTRREAAIIADLAGHSEVLEALDFQASRAAATDPDLSQYRIVHFATHGILDSRYPELSGIVLSLVDEDGKPQDGFLPVQDVYNLKLGADLVVLSACQTALGKEVRGEGLVGLVRGFMYAGSPRVLASLWRVPDAPTAALMRRFYTGMLSGSLRPAAALRAAQVALLGDRRWSAPYAWAGFTLEGEWK